MTQGFWSQLNKPIMALAPLHDVTDTVFRRVIAKRGKPDVMFTEFVSVDGLVHEVSREKMIWRYLQYSEIERPLVAQIWGTDPLKYYEAARLLTRLGFDGLDINMGCPEKSAVKHGACSSLIDQPKLAQAIIRATMKGAGELPVSVKTRLGFKKNVIEEWVKYLLETGPTAITIHGRLAKDLSRVPADWDSIGRAAQIAKGSRTLIIGNGDVGSLSEAEEKVKIYGVDGVMFGRAILNNHWLFNPAFVPTKLGTTAGKPELVIKAKLERLVEHAELYEQVFQGKRNFSVLGKHFKSYTQGIPGSYDLRLALRQAKNAAEVKLLVEKYY